MVFMDDLPRHYCGVVSVRWTSIARQNDRHNPPRDNVSGKGASSGGLGARQKSDCRQRRFQQNRLIDQMGHLADLFALPMRPQPGLVIENAKRADCGIRGIQYRCSKVAPDRIPLDERAFQHFRVFVGFRNSDKPLFGDDASAKREAGRILEMTKILGRKAMRGPDNDPVARTIEHGEFSKSHSGQLG
nr:hypothetical protein [Kangsaoukella pontilimi]